MKLHAVLRGEFEFLVGTPMSDAEVFEFFFEMFEKRFFAEGFFAIGPTLGEHLQDAEIDAQLNDFAPLTSFETPGDDLPGFVFPLLKKVGDVVIHGGNMEGGLEQVKPAQADDHIGLPRVEGFEHGLDLGHLVCAEQIRFAEGG